MIMIMVINNKLWSLKNDLKLNTSMSSRILLYQIIINLSKQKRRIFNSKRCKLKYFVDFFLISKNYFFSF